MQGSQSFNTPGRVWMVTLGILALLAGAAVASANPKDIPAGSKLAYNFNVIGYPEGQTYTGGCGEGHRIFVNRGANNAHVLVKNASSWGVLDCNATSDRTASLGTNQAASTTSM